MRRWSLAAPVALIVVTCAPACSSSDGGDAEPASTTPGASTAAPSTSAVPATTNATAVAPTATAATTATTAAPTTAPGSDPNATIDDAVDREGLEALLLNPGDVRPDFVEVDVDIPPGTTPCGFSLDQSFPADQVGTVLQSGDGSHVLLEEIHFYASTADAAAAYAALVEGLSCAGDDEYTLGAVEDVSFELDATASAVTFSSDDSEGVIIVAELAEVLVGFQFRRSLGDEASAPDPVDVARAGVQRVVEYVEA